MAEQETSKDQIVAMVAQKIPSATSEDLIRYGYTEKGAPIFLHKPTGKRYVANNALPGRRIPPEQVAAAVSMYYGGLSLREIRRTFAHAYDFAPSTATIYEWVVDYTRLAQNALGEAKAHSSDTWVADEQVQRIGGKKLWLWSVMDARTRYLLATHVSETRTIRDAETLFRRAERASRNKPTRIITDGLAAYADGIDHVFGGDVRHVTADEMKGPVDNNLSERLQGTIRQRSKVMRGMKKKETAELILNGWTLHYNYFKPHEALKGRTPAKAAGIDYPLKDWEMVARQDVRHYSQLRARHEQERAFRDKAVGTRHGLMLYRQGFRRSRRRL